MNLSSGAHTHKSERLIPQRSRGHQSPAQSLGAIAQRRRDHASWAAQAARIGTDGRSLTAAVLEVLVSAGIIRLDQSTIELRTWCQRRKRTPWACRSTCAPARRGKPVIILVRTVTSDGPDGRPWPPPDSNTLWAVVRRADGCTFWRAIQLAEVRSAAPDAISQRQQAQWRIRNDKR